MRQILTKNPRLFFELRQLHDASLVFGRYDYLITRYSDKEMMDFLLTYGTSTVNTDLRSSLFREAALFGRADIVRYAYEFKSDEEPFALTNKSPVLYKTQDTASLEVLMFVAELRELHSIPHDEEDFQLAYRLGRCIDAGQLDTVRYAIQLGAHPRGPGGSSRARGNLPMGKACMRGRIAIVEHLLACGAGPERTIEFAAT